mmetsp:Transcript_1790/g.5214  ORF Transcript_1790/g.5214 Transcript_1790/m.5214 type:complete len:205 (-) Transcript_1790:661-1275(-)
MRASTMDFSRCSSMDRVLSSFSSASCPSASSAVNVWVPSFTTAAALASAIAWACTAASASLPLTTSVGGTVTRVMRPLIRIWRLSRTNRRLARSLSSHRSPLRTGSEIATSLLPGSIPISSASLPGATDVTMMARPLPSKIPPNLMSLCAARVHNSTSSLRPAEGRTVGGIIQRPIASYSEQFVCQLREATEQKREPTVRKPRF